MRTFMSVLVIGCLLVMPFGFSMAQEQLANGRKVVKSAPPGQPPQKSLKLPFERKTKWEVGEGFHYFEEQIITGDTGHGAVDFEAVEGTNLYAPCSGWAVASFQTRPPITEIDPNNPGKERLRLYRGKPIHNGAGICFQIWDPKTRSFTLIGHMSKVDMRYYKEPERDADGFYRPSPLLKPDYQPEWGWVWVNQGDWIGQVGNSGLGQFQETFQNIAHKNTSWDGSHAHLWHGTRNSSGARAINYDPFGYYGTTWEFPGYRNKEQDPLYGLFLTYTSGRYKGQIMYAKE